METLVRELKKDAELSVFLSADCSVSAIASGLVAKDSVSNHNASSSSILSTHSVGDEASHSEQFIQRIDLAVHKIDRVITEHISEHHDSLLHHVGSVDGLQDRVASTQSSVRHLKHAVGDLEAMVQQQHQRLRKIIQKHRNVEKCGSIVRRVLRFQQLLDRILGSFLYESLASTDAHHHGTKLSRRRSKSDVESDSHTAELLALAVAVREIDTLVQDPSFEDLSVVRMRLPTIRRISTTMKRDVRGNLRTAMQSLSQADMGDALQILFYLGVLSESVQTTVNDVIQDVERKCTVAIAEDHLVTVGNTSNIRTSGTVANGGNTEVTVHKADVWKAIQELFEVVRVHALQVWNLQRVLVKMDAPTSARSSRSNTDPKTFLDLVIEQDEPTLFTTFWDVSCAIMRELFTGTMQYRTLVKNVLIAEYPRMREEAHRVLADLYAATNQNRDTKFILGDDSLTTRQPSTRRQTDVLSGIAATPTETNLLLEAMAPLFDGFADRAYRKMASPIQLMFPQSANFHTSPPARSDMQTLARTIFAELELAGNDPILIESTLQQLRKAVNLFCTNVKRLMHTGKAVTTTTSTLGRTAAQAHNVSLISVLHYLDDAVKEVAKRVAAKAVDLNTHGSVSFSHFNDSTVLSNKAAKSLCEKLLVPCHNTIRDLESSMLGQYLQGLAVLVEDIFAKMHEESFGSRASNDRAPMSNSAIRSQSSGGGSRFMSEFSTTITVIVDEHIRRLPSADFVSSAVSDFVVRLISVFIRHASLLRPLEEDGKLRLANDMAQLELRLEHIMPLKPLGAPYDELRAFRHMMFLEANAILRDSTVDKIRPSNVWHHLIARGPPELQFPHQMKQWRAGKYITWLDTVAGQEAATTSGDAPLSGQQISLQELPLGYPCLKDRRASLNAEREAWKEVTKCLDAYAQRVSAIATADLSPIYDVVQESGAILLAGYEMTVSRW